jgi:hypothetical protein
VGFSLLRKVDIPDTNPWQSPYLDISDVPVFQLQKPNVFVDLKAAIVKIVALIIVSIMLFYLSFLSFIKYDVR